MVDDGEVLGRDNYLEVIAYSPDVFGYNYTFGGAAVAAGAWDRDKVCGDELCIEGVEVAGAVGDGGFYLGQAGFKFLYVVHNDFIGGWRAVVLLHHLLF